MSDSSKSVNEKIIKSKKRVQNHGEVFTPKRIVNKILDLPNIREACLNLTSTFLEPAAGEGIFLAEVLKRKLKMVVNNYSDDIGRYENYSLLALSTLYGIELLEDNAKKCVMNMYQVFYEEYHHQAVALGTRTKIKVLDSAKLIISNNIAQGNFLNKLSPSGDPIVFSEWHPINISRYPKTIRVQRTEYTINDILKGVNKESGEHLTQSLKLEQQLDWFCIMDGEESVKIEQKRMKYVPVKIIDVYKEEMEEING